MADVILPQSKFCSACKIQKELSSFNLQRSSKDGRRYICKACQSEHKKKYRAENKEKVAGQYSAYYRSNKDKVSARIVAWGRSNPDKLRQYYVKKTYGLSKEQFHRLLESHSGRCHICGSEDAGSKSGTFNIDHCHKTGEVRGMLCGGCNHVLGRVSDSVDLLKKYIAYLEDPPARKIIAK